jgi:hypothetical protein
VTAYSGHALRQGFDSLDRLESNQIKMTIKLNGKTYETKTHNGYVFASESLADALSEVDNQIAFFFDDETFSASSAEELYKEYNQHS